MIEPTLRVTYSEYIAKGIRYATSSISAKKMPKSIKIVVEPYSPLADEDKIVGISILVGKLCNSYEFIPVVQFNPTSEDIAFIDSFIEYMNLYPLTY